MSEFRRDIVTGQWVIIASERGKRPSDFKLKVYKGNKGSCPFCAGNEKYTPPAIYTVEDEATQSWLVRVVPNKFPALGGNEDDNNPSKNGLFPLMNGNGKHEIIIETPLHAQRLKDFSVSHLREIFKVYRERIKELSANEYLKYILIFKNEGRQAGASLEHSHSQLIATPVVPQNVRIKLNGAKEYFQRNLRCVFCAILEEETRKDVRILLKNDYFTAFTPFASRIPYEINITPARHQHDFKEISDIELNFLAKTVKKIMTALDKALDSPPYNMILHNRPLSENSSAIFHWHLEILPKLATLAGFELGTGIFINPTPPEEAAVHLKQFLR